MERPSHSIKALQFHTGPRRATGMGLSFLIPPLLGLGLMWGFVAETVKPLPPTDYIDVQEKVEQRTPPPPVPNTVKPLVPTVTAPTVLIEAPSGGTTITTMVPQTKESPVPTPPQPKPNPVPDRAAVSIAALSDPRAAAGRGRLGDLAPHHPARRQGGQGRGGDLQRPS